MDAIFKEDVGVSNKELILSFIGKFTNGTQLVCSVAESICEVNGNIHTVYEYNNKFLNNSANLIKTGDMARSLLKSNSHNHKVLLEETISIMTE